MGNDSDKKQSELKAIEQELGRTGLSRRSFLSRMQAVGLGFGAAYLLGFKKAEAGVLPEGPPGAAVTLKSTNPAIDKVLEEARKERLESKEPNPEKVQVAQYTRYARIYPRYGRVYPRYGRVYGRVYPRYGRVYTRIYPRYTRIYARVFPGPIIR